MATTIFNLGAIEQILAIVQSQATILQRVVATQADHSATLFTVKTQGAKSMALLDDLEAAATATMTLLKTTHDELVEALAMPQLDPARVQAVVDKLNAAVSANPDPEHP
jgi:hypothetical protein